MSVSSVFQNLSTVYLEEITEKTVEDVSTDYFKNIPDDEDDPLFDSPALTATLKQYKSQISSVALDYFVDKVVDHLFIGGALAGAYLLSRTGILTGLNKILSKTPLGRKAVNMARGLAHLSPDGEDLRGSQSFIDTTSQVSNLNYQGIDKTIAIRDSRMNAKRTKNAIEHKNLTLATAKKQSINDAFFNLAKSGQLKNTLAHRKIIKASIGIKVSSKDIDNINKVFATDYIKDAKTNITKTSAELVQERIASDGYTSL